MSAFFEKRNFSMNTVRFVFNLFSRFSFHFFTCFNQKSNSERTRKILGSLSSILQLFFGRMVRAFYNRMCSIHILHILDIPILIKVMKQKCITRKVIGNENLHFLR